MNMENSKYFEVHLIFCSSYYKNVFESRPNTRILHQVWCRSCFITHLIFFRCIFCFLLSLHGFLLASLYLGNNTFWYMSFSLVFGFFKWLSNYEIIKKMLPAPFGFDFLVLLAFFVKSKIRFKFPQFLCMVVTATMATLVESSVTLSIASMWFSIFSTSCSKYLHFWPCFFLMLHDICGTWDSCSKTQNREPRWYVGLS